MRGGHAAPLAAGLCLMALAGCVAPPGPQASREEVVARRYTAPDRPYIELISNVRTSNGEAAHTAMVINASQRVVYNPAGTWWHPDAPERGDLHYGFTPAMERWFIDYHARETFQVEVQRRYVSAETAEAVLRRAEATGGASEGFCTYVIGDVLNGAPEFEGFPRAFFPGQAKRAFGRLPGVTTQVYTDDDRDDRSDLPPPIAVIATDGTGARGPER